MCLNHPCTHEIISYFSLHLSLSLKMLKKKKKQTVQRTNSPFPPFLLPFLGVQGLQAHPGEKRTLKLGSFLQAVLDFKQRGRPMGSVQFISRISVSSTFPSTENL